MRIGPYTMDYLNRKQLARQVSVCDNDIASVKILIRRGNTLLLYVYELSEPTRLSSPSYGFRRSVENFARARESGTRGAPCRSSRSPSLLARFRFRSDRLERDGERTEAKNDREETGTGNIRREIQLGRDRDYCNSAREEFRQVETVERRRATKRRKI